VTETFWVLAASLVIGVALGAAGRTLLRSRVRLSWSDAVLAGLLGAVAGSLVGGLLPGGPRPWLAGVIALVATAAVLLGMERLAARRRQVRGGVEDLIRAGESGSVEFKSSARYNRHSGKRDERVERAVTKTIAGFSNAEGGVLLVGVADDGSITGLEDDYTLLKAGDRDRFELWLRDMLALSIGLVATADLAVEFDAVDGHDVSRITVPAARRPVFVHTPGSQSTTLFVRVGNSTRELDVEAGLTYCLDRWGGRALRSGGRPRARR
jgi:uncharacterized membrane protein YeaQ/YmgE (transglycosylase-associated protein family)